MCDVRWRQTQLRHSYMLSLAAPWITASLLTGVCDGVLRNGVLRKLQSVQNAAARLITNTRKFDHITPVSRDLHWLPVRQQIVFKTALLVYKCLRGRAFFHRQKWSSYRFYVCTNFTYLNHPPLKLYYFINAVHINTVHKLTASWHNWPFCADVRLNTIQRYKQTKPPYLSEFCRTISTLPGRWQLRSGTIGILHVPRTRTSIGSWSFAVAGPVTWKSLPADLGTLELSVAAFAKRLKT